MSKTPMKLISFSNLLAQSKIHHKKLLQVLEDAGVKVAAEVPQGKGSARFYNQAEAVAAIEAYQRAEAELAAKAAEVKAAEVKSAAKAAPAAVDLSPITAMIESQQRQLTLLFDQQIDGQDWLGPQLQALKDQNVALLRAVEKMGTNLDARLDSLHNLVVNARLAPTYAPASKVDQDLRPNVNAPAPAVKPPVPPGLPQPKIEPGGFDKMVAGLATAERAKHNPETKPAAKPNRTKVCIVGLVSTQAALIQKEFGTELELRFYTSEESKTKGFLKALTNHDHVIAMVAFINHGLRDIVVAAGSKLIRLPGGVSGLKTKLTEIWMQQANEVSA